MTSLEKSDLRPSLIKKSAKGERTLRLMRGIGGVTIVGTLTTITPYLITGYAGMGVSLVLTFALFGMAAWTWREVRISRLDAQQEILLREAFHSMLTPQLITNEQGVTILANRAFRGWIDLGTQNAEQALASRFSASAAVTAEFKQIKTSLQKGQPGIAELPVVRGGKIVEWRRIVARPIDGFTGYYHWRFEDISERRRMERAMRDEQNKLVDFMAHAPVGIYSVDQHGRFRFVNRTLAEWLQVSPEELVKGSVHFHDIIVGPTPGISAHAIVAGQQGDMRGEVTLRRRNGQSFPAAITQTVVLGDDGKTLRTRSIVRDLSPEKEWQQALSVSEYRFQRLFAEAPIGVVLLDSKFVITECNHAFHSIIRQPRANIVGTPLASLVLEKDRAAMIGKLSEVLNEIDLLKPLDLRMAADREIICQAFVKRFSVAGDQGQAGPEQKGLMLYFIDTTEQKHLEMQFAQSQKMQAIGQLAGGIAHDFNNLLTAMIGFCDLLLQRHKPGDQSFNDIMQIKQNGNRAANLVRQLLAFSRQQTLQPKIIVLADALSELTNLLRRLIGAQIQLDMVHGRDIGLVKVDAGQLEQVIINLVVNARDAMPNGGKVTIRTFSAKQDKPVVRGQDIMVPGDYVAIEVTDTGHGIPPEIMQRIFEPFFSTKEIGSGTGLGLSTVYGIVRQTGGFVDVKSVVNKGTTFTVYLPEHKDGVGTPPPPQSDEQREDKAGPDLTGAGTILLVEDEDAVRMFSARALRNKGYNVLEARSGEEALTVLEKDGDKVDLTVTDVVMPQMDGPTLYKHIRTKWPNMRVVFVSGYTEDRLREQFKSGETIYFLPKPFTLKQLASKVKEVLGEE